MKLPRFPAFVSLVHAIELYDMAEALQSNEQETTGGTL